MMPFHNPVRLAEDIATVDVISGGRFELGVGIGFKREEFEGFGVPFKERGARTNQSLEIIRRALAGETVTFKSEFFEFQNIKVTPIRIRLVRAAIAAATGRIEGRYPSSMKWCSDSQTSSNPLFSAHAI
jgi:alkanesulfonate monooxygenase SsuD/methylene tetrahydromethanopterin reductase-like flavin-dependent oxidoreductase (luciferase family)